MRPVCHLHIGMNKAGSTTIQAAFADYADDALEYLRPADAPVLHEVLDRTFRRPRDVDRFAGSPEILARADAAFDALLRRSDRAALVSYENLSIWPDKDAVAAIRDRLLTCCAEVRVLVYVRPPRAYLRSVLQERLKLNPLPPDLGALWPRYRARLLRWDEVFGRDAVAPVPLRRRDLIGGDLLADVCARIGADPARLAPSPAANEAATLEGSAVLAVWQAARAAGRWGPAEADAPEALARFARTLAGFGTTERWGFEPEAMEAIVAPRGRDLRWISDRMGCPDFGDETTPSACLPGPEALIGIGQDSAPALRDWLSARDPGLRFDGTKGTEDLMQAAFLRSLLGQPGWRARIATATRALRR